MADFNIIKGLKLKGNATYTSVDNSLSLRIPKVKINSALLYEASESMFLSLSYQFNDNRADSVYNSTTYQNDIIDLKSYNIFDFYIIRRSESE